MANKWLKMYLVSCLLFLFAEGQNGSLSGRISDIYSNGIYSASVSFHGMKKGTLSDSAGYFIIQNIPNGKYELVISHSGFNSYREIISLADSSLTINVVLTEPLNELDEVVVSGSLKEVSKLESAVPVEVYSAKFFKANPTPSLFDALQHINGIRPQLNCNVCNTGDIHINGLEGPYTMVLIDGMPIVSGLSTVYGLSGIPQSLIERIEIVRGPASTLYGSEAVGGLINIITKRPYKAPLFSTDVFATSWNEFNADISSKLFVSNNSQTLIGVNLYNYSHPVDNNNDNFTDVTLQKRISLFNKWNFERKQQRTLTFAGRFVYEDRWGGEMNWSKKFRGRTEVYGESIYTRRWEIMSNYQLPIKEKIFFQFCANGHNQNSFYGNIPFMANQKIVFGQFTWFKTAGKHDLLTGLAYRYTYYDDNTPATQKIGANNPTHTSLPGVFVQDEISINDNNKLLLGMRYDYNSIHGSILTPRINYKRSSANKNNVIRLSFGNGYRVANVFTEDHAALTGAREVVFIDHLKPETSWNGNINFVKKIKYGNNHISFDASAFYTYFTNKIVANYDLDPNKIIYGNLNGYAVSKGISLNVDFAFDNGLKILSGVTAMDVYSKINGKKIKQLFSEKFTGTWNISYTLKSFDIVINYTGNFYGAMRLPLLSENDPRREYSKTWSIQNIQLTKKIKEDFEVYGGLKNILNWTPNNGNPFIIARSHDPFDKNVQFDVTGRALVTPENPYGLTFDPSYVYGPNQGLRGFLGIRYILK